MDHPPEVWGDFQFGHRCLKVHNVPSQSFKISQYGYSVSQTIIDGRKSGHVRLT
jgi:predicted metalloenzyme YecM